MMYLLLSGRVEKFVLAPGGNWLIPWHVGALTKRGHYVNFFRLLPHEQNTFGAWWFAGSFRGIRRSQWRAKIGKRGRLRLVSPAAGFAIELFLHSVVAVPYCLAFAAYWPLWALYWVVTAIRRRRVSDGQ